MKSKNINPFFPSLRSGHRLFQRPSSPPRSTILCFALIAAGASSSMAQTTWQGTSAGNWTDSARWNNGVPSGNGAVISVAAPVTLNTSVSNITTLLASNGMQLNIQSGASLTTTGLVRLGASGARSTLNFTEGNFTTAEMRVGSDTGTGTAHFSGGTWRVNGAFMVGANSVLNLSGSAHLNNAPGTGMSSMNGTINQTGGTFTNGNNNLNITNGTYNLSGGALNVTYANRDIVIENGSALRIVGSGSSVSLNRNIVTYTNSNRGRLVFVLDNSAQHNTTIQSSSFNTNHTVRLEAELRGGVLLSGKDHYDLLEAGSFSTTTGGFASTPGPLWTTSIAADVNGTRDAVRIQLAAGQLRGNADAASMNALSFTAASQGYVTLSSVDLSQTLILGLDITGGTLSNFTNALTAANIMWSEGSGDYEVNLLLDPAISGGNFFAWDFSSFDSGMRLQGLAVIPEPSSTLLVAAGLMAAAMFRRRRV